MGAIKIERISTTVRDIICPCGCIIRLDETSKEEHVTTIKVCDKHVTIEKVSHEELYKDPTQRPYKHITDEDIKP